MKILFLSGDLCDGGAQRVIATISSKLADMEHEVYLIVFSKSERDYPLSSKVILKYMCQNSEEYQHVSHIKRLLFLRREIKKIHPDVGVGFLQAGYALLFSSIGFKFPRIASARVTPTKIINAKGMVASITRFWFRHADAVVLQNNEQLKQVKNCKWKNKTVICNPLNDKLLNEQNIIYKDKCEKFVMVGRLAQQKNYSMVIKAVKILHSKNYNIKLDIFGEGELKEELEAEIIKCGLQGIIVLKGWTDNIIYEYLKYDAYLLTSNFEGQPNSLMEALAVGLPCISTMCETGPKELIDNGVSGILIETNNQTQLIKAMQQMVNMTACERKKMGHEARNKMLDSYNVSVIARKWEKLFENIIRK